MDPKQSARLKKKSSLQKKRYHERVKAREGTSGTPQTAGKNAKEKGKKEKLPAEIREPAPSHAHSAVQVISEWGMCGKNGDEGYFPAG